MKHTTRRQFIQHTGAATGIALAAGYGPLARSDEQKIRVGLIGVGARCREHLREGIWGTDEIDGVAVADVYSPHQKGGRLQAWLANAQLIGKPETTEEKARIKAATEPTGYYDYAEMLVSEDLDAVLIATPPHTHHAIIMDCLNAGKHVFCETPLATSIADAREVAAKMHETGLVVQVGHQRRYHPNYNLAMKRFREERLLGRLTGIETCRYKNEAERRILDRDYTFNGMERKLIKTDLEHHLNWRLYADLDGGPCLDLLPLSIDTANWFCGVAPTKVYASAGVDYWKDGRTSPDNMAVTFDYRRGRNSETFRAINGRNDYQDMLQLNRSCTLRATYAYSLAGTPQNADERITGDEGSVAISPRNESMIFLEATSAYYQELVRKERERLLKVREADLKRMTKGMTDNERRLFHITIGRSYDPPGWRDKPPTDYPINAVGSEESAELHQFRAFAHHIRHGGMPRANVMVGLAAVIAGASARKSLDTGNAVDIDPAWMEFDFETPSITDYDHDVEAIEV